MELQTKISLSTEDNQIDYESELVLLGSCFSENIGKKFEYFKFRSLQNPFGIMFHPKAIENLITKSINQETYSDADIFFHNEQWHCFDSHSDLSSGSKEDLLKKLNDGLENTSQQLTRSTHVVITLGTAWVYRHLERNIIVSNCHKIPQKEFKKELLAIDTITNILKNSISALKSVNDKIEIIFTISPVRHLRDGFLENQRSKAHLISAVHKIIDESDASYFPSYEIMMDELRDYRFCEVDMIHPNQQAIDYIWEKFKTVRVSEKAYPTMEEVVAIQKGLKHRPFMPNSEEHLNFIRSLDNKITYLKEKHPFMDFDQERAKHQK